ncbi:signal peptidase 22 kDa subunit, partial [Rhodotorula sp. JG-1b]
MHSTWQRLSNVSALATTVLLALLAAVAASSYVIPATLSPATLKVPHLNVVLGRPQYERRAKEREYAFVKFDLKAAPDLTPLFNWNTKQLFVYMVADYSNTLYPENSVVVWDRIIRSPKYARLNVQDGKQKYEFKEITDTFSNTSATFSLQYHVQPWVGPLRRGEVVRTEPIAFPPVRRR